jgi:predicted nucleic acid-binding protein
VILLDAFPLVALLVDEPAAERVERLLRGGPTGITAPALAEVVDHLVRRRGVEEIHVRRLLEALADSGFVVLHMPDETPWIAGRLRSRHHDRRRSPLSLADCVLLATAGPSDAIATADGPLAAAARAEGIDVIALVDAHGRRPKGLSVSPRRTPRPAPTRA